MKVTAALFGDLRWRLPLDVGALSFQLADNSTVADLGQTIGLEAGEIWKVSIGGRLVGEDHLLSDGDTVLFFPPIGGG